MNSSYRSSRDGMNSVPLSHSKLQELIRPFFDEPTEPLADDVPNSNRSMGSNQNGSNGSLRTNSSPGDILLDDILFDFGCRYRVIVSCGGSSVGSGLDSPDASTESGESMNINAPPDTGPSQSPSISSHTIMLHVSVIGWEQVEQSTIARLKTIVGEDNVITQTHHHKKDQELNELEDLHPMTKVAPGYNVSFRVYSNALPKGFDKVSMASWLSNIRAEILGSGLHEALSQLHPSRRQIDNVTGGNGSFVIPIQRSRPSHVLESGLGAKVSSTKPTSLVDKLTSSTSASPSPPTTPTPSYPSMIVSYQVDRVTIVIPFIFYDETDRALARLFLSQFHEAQRRAMSSLTAVPICDYRRANDPPREILEHCRTGRHENKDGAQGGLDGSNNGDKNERDLLHDTSKLAGYLSLTFLEHHVDTAPRVEAAVHNVLMLVDLIDYHVKCSKSNMHSRMRKKKDIFLKRLMLDKY